MRKTTPVLIALSAQALTACGAPQESGTARQPDPGGLGVGTAAEGESEPSGGLDVVGVRDKDDTDGDGYAEPGAPPPDAPGDPASHQGGGGEGGNAEAPQDEGGRTIDVGVGQGGAKDFGVFRRILDNRGLPLAETLDDVGFFAEHHTELPPPDCGQPLCAHAMLAVSPHLVTGEPYTMMQVGMNARIPEEALTRRPLNLAIAIDTSGSMKAAGKIEFVRAGLELMVDQLEEEDEVSVVVYSNEANVVAEASGVAEREGLKDIVRRLAASGGTNVYAGLERAFELVRDHQQPGRQNRVILLSDGNATVGVTDDQAILDMARDHTEEGIGLTTIGVGDEFNVQLMRQLSESGSGNFYFLEDEAATEEVFVEELAFFVTPVATDLRLEVHSGDGYELGEVFGTKLWVTQGAGGIIDIPSVFVAHRQSHDDQEQGRRGGGSAILLDMLPAQGWEELEDPTLVGRLRLTYLPSGAALREEQTVEIRYPNGPAVLVADGWFDGGDGEEMAVEKNFVMLQVYLGLLGASELVGDGELDGAWGVLGTLEVALEAWLEDNDDEDLEADLAVVGQFLDNLESHGAGSPLE